MLGQGWADYLLSRPELAIQPIVCTMAEVVRTATEERPSYILLDMLSLSVEGLQTIASLRHAAKKARFILLLSGYESPQYVRRLMDSSIVGLLSRQSSVQELLDCMAKAAIGGVHISQDLNEKAFMERQPEEAPSLGIYALSKRELQIANFIVTGMTTRQIAVVIGLSTKTVEVHRHHILRKLKLTKSVSLVNLLTGRHLPVGQEIT